MLASMLVACGLTVTGTQEEAATGEPGAPGADSAAPLDATTRSDGADVGDAGAVDVADAAVDAEGGPPDTGPPPPPYTITSDGGTWTVHEDAGPKRCSTSSSTPATIVFRNQSGSTIEHIWVTYDPPCKEDSYGEIQPGASATRSSFATHPWRVRRANDDALLLYFTPNGGGTYVVTIY